MGQIDIRNLMKVFGDGDEEVVAVDGHDFTIEDGEFLILVGPSGCGKSTTLRCIAGLERPTSGQIILDGEDVTSKKPRDRDMAMVFQNYALYPHMTARENMSFGLKMATDLSKAEIEERVTDAARMMGIESLLEDKPKELSGGQQQRVALGRAIVREPEVFLMDEPLSNLDAKLRTQMRTELQQLQQNLDITTIYVTHDQEEAMTMGDKIAVLKDGKLQQLGSPLELYHQPANQFVAGFIGSPSMNFLEVGLADSERAAAFVHDGFEYELEAETYDAVRGQGTRFVLGIRPEAIKLADNGDQDSIHADVTVVEPLGDVTYVYLDIGGSQVTAQMDGELQIEEGSTIPVEFPQNLIHVFDAETGESLKHREAPQDTTVADLTI